MKKSICHYSFHRTWREKNWDCEQLGKAVRELGIEAVDFHAKLLGSPEVAAERILSTLKKAELELSGLSLGNDFNKSDPEEFKAQVNTVIEWIYVAAKVNAPVSRIFGGSIPGELRHDEKARKKKLPLIMEGLKEVTKVAEKEGVILALENHGGLPCSGGEQIQVIKTIDSKHLRATIDVGNYMNCGQEGHVGTEIVAPYAAYVHFKDFKRVPDDKSPAGFKLQACVVGKGDVDHIQCLKALAKAGYNGYIALEYEGVEGEEKGIRESVAYMNKVMETYI